jgi:hypothetical protein
MAEWAGLTRMRSKTQRIQQTNERSNRVRMARLVSVEIESALQLLGPVCLSVLGSSTVMLVSHPTIFSSFHIFQLPFRKQVFLLTKMSVICSFHFHSDIYNTDFFILSNIPVLVCSVSSINGAEGLLINITFRDMCIILLPIIFITC